MKRIEVLNLTRVFESLKNAKGINFAYALMKNKKIQSVEEEHLKTSLVTSDRYKEFVEKVSGLVKSKCDIEGDVVTLENLKVKEGEDLDALKTSILEFQKEYAEDIAQRKTAVREYQSFIRDDSDAEFYKIKETHLPDELTLQDLIMLSEIVDYDEYELSKQEFTNYSILIYSNLFNQIIGLPTLADLSPIVRNKCLLNFTLLRKAHKELYASEIIKNWLAYEEKRKALAESFASTDVFGDSLVQKNEQNQDEQFVIVDQESFQKELTLLGAEYEETLKAFYDFLNEKRDVDLCKFAQSELPDTFSLTDLQVFEIFLKN